LFYLKYSQQPAFALMIMDAMSMPDAGIPTTQYARRPTYERAPAESGSRLLLDNDRLSP